MSEERFARQYLYGPPPGFPLASTCASIVHHLSGPNIHAQASILHPKISITADEEHISVIIQSISLRLGVYNSRTRTYVRLLGPCFKTGRITTPNNNVKMNKRKQKETKINRTTMAVTKEIRVTTTDEQEQSLLS